MWKDAFVMTCLSFAFATANAAPWIAVDWAGKEPQFPPGSLFWKTSEYPRCPVFYRTVLEIDNSPLAFAGIRIRALEFAYIFLNGHHIASYIHKDEEPNFDLDVEFNHLLKPGRNVLAISTTADGFSLKGLIGYTNMDVRGFSSDKNQWKVQKFPPLTILEQEPCMQPSFGDTDWFSVKEIDREPVGISEVELEKVFQRLAVEQLEQLDKDAQWRLNMLADKGIAIVNWEAYSWAGSERLPDWVCDTARQALNEDNKPGWQYNVAEALTWYVRLSDDATNLENYVVGLKVLEAPAGEIETCRKTASVLREVLDRMKHDIHDGKYAQASATAVEGEMAVNQVRSVRIINNLCCCLDNKFGWFDTNALLDNDISGWGLRIGSSARIFASPLSPAVYITVGEKELVIQGWDGLQPLRVYNKPATLGPVCLWAVFNGKVKNLKPDEGGIVYDRLTNGKLSENWVLLVNDLSAGGHLPIELVFLQAPARIVFKAGDKGTSEVTITFDERGARLFALRPLREWRGLLHQARVMKDVPLNEAEAQQYIEQCRFWSRSLLNYPVTFSEVFVRNPQDEQSLLCADVYNYWEQRDEWNTQPIQIASLSPLATYGLMMQYPGLEVISETQTLGSRGVWGDHIAAVGQNYIVYRVPLDPIKRFGGFTSFCFGGTDIGEPGSITEIETIKLTGANSFRPQHNQTGERAMKTLQWCWERGIQNVFNTDEKWVPDIYKHFRILAEKCKDYPPDAVAYDLLNEPETRDPRNYDALIRKITLAIRESDKTHLIYVEAFPPWGPSASPFPYAAFENLKPTGDKLTCYSFHDYEFRLPSHWPNEQHDIRDILARWVPAFKFSIDSRQPIHLGEFGGFEQTEQNVYDNPCAITLMMDYFKIFDQFGWHWHYYSNRGTVRVREDGSLQDSCVQEAHRRYFARGTFNVNR